MKLFIYEYATALPGLDLPAALRREGRAMFDAVYADAQAVPGVELLTLECHADPEQGEFQRLAARADWSFIIAPETDERLLERAHWVTEAGGRLLGPSQKAIQITGDKWETCLQWRAAGVRTPNTWLLPPLRGDNERPMVRKLRDGAGSQDMRLVPPSEHWTDDPRWLWQEFVPGHAASVAFLIGAKGRPVPLLPAAQHLTQDGTCRYRGGSVPLEPSLGLRALTLATQAIDAIPGLFGYVGVDLVLGDAPDGSQDYAIEINPRLTTSYVGLRAMAEENLMGVLLALANGVMPPPIRWMPGQVTFTATGQVQRPA